MPAQLAHIARKMDSVRRAFAGETGEAGDETAGESGGWLPEFIDARRALKHVLLLRATTHRPKSSGASRRSSAMRIEQYFSAF